MGDGGHFFPGARNISWNIHLSKSSFIHLFVVVEIITKFNGFNPIHTTHRNVYFSFLLLLLSQETKSFTNVSLK